MLEADRNFGVAWFEEVWNKQRREAIAEMMAPDALIHEAGATSRGPRGFYPFFDSMTAMFSGIAVQVHDTLAEGDKICVRWSCTMKHTGPGLGRLPTGKVLTVTGISIIRVAGGKAIEAWQNWDMLGMMNQMDGARGGAPYIALQEERNSP